MSARVGTWFLVGAGVAVAASIAAALSVIGSPAHQRAQRFDERRVRDLSRIDSTIDTYWATEGHLPTRLSDLIATDGDLVLADPATAVPYGYRVVDVRHYTLCAVFATDSRRDDEQNWTATARWNRHPDGRHCVDRAMAQRDAAKPGADAAAAEVETPSPR